MQCQRKAVDPRIIELIQRCSQNKTRALLVIQGSSAVERVADIYGLWINKTLAPKASMLWCYENNIALSGYRQKQLKKLKHNKKMAIQRDVTDEDTPQNLMLRHATIKFMYYKDSRRALGQTYDMVVLQEAAGVTPSLLCHTIETVQGGGLALLLDTNNSLDHSDMFVARTLSYINSCKSALILNDVLDVISPCRFLPNDNSDSTSMEGSVTESNKMVVGTSTNEVADATEEASSISSSSMCPLELTRLCLTEDQSSALATAYASLFHTSTSVSSIPNVVSIVAPRGRGKSALLGLLIAAVCVHSNSQTQHQLRSDATGHTDGNEIMTQKPNIMLNVASNLERVLVVAPMADAHSGPLTTIHPHCLRGLEALGLVRGIHYNTSSDIGSNGGTTVGGSSSSSSSPSSAPRGTSFPIRLRTTTSTSSHVVSYIDSCEIIRIFHSGPGQLNAFLSAFDLVLVDEAAQLPIPVVKAMSGMTGTSGVTQEVGWGLQRHVVLSSTVHGYEGTGRALAVKLFGEIEKLHKVRGSSSGNSSNMGGQGYVAIKLREPIRYAPNCQVEWFLNKLLLLDEEINTNKGNGVSPASSLPSISNTLFFVISPHIFLPFYKGLPPGDVPNLLERLLTKAYGLFTAAHYRNTPEDIRRMLVGDGGAGASRHGMAVLVERQERREGREGGDIKGDLNVLSAVHFALEGGASYSSSYSTSSNAANDTNVQGHLAPGVLESYFQERRQMGETEGSSLSSFSNILGVRVVRIATRQDAQGMGYGRALMKGLAEFFSGELGGCVEEGETERGYTPMDEVVKGVVDWALGKRSGVSESSDGKPISQRLPPLLISKQDFIRCPSLVPAIYRCARNTDAGKTIPLPKYIAVSFGLSPELLRFYALLGFSAVFLKGTQNSATGEHSCIVVKEIGGEGEGVKEKEKEKETIKEGNTTKSKGIKRKGETKKNKLKGAELDEPSPSLLRGIFTSWASDFSWRLLRESRCQLRQLGPELVLRLLKANDEYCRRNFSHYLTNVAREREYAGTSTVVGPHRTPLLSARDMLRLASVAGIAGGRCSISYNSMSGVGDRDRDRDGGCDDSIGPVAGWRLISDLLPVLVDIVFSESPACFSTTTHPDMEMGLTASKGGAGNMSKVGDRAVLALTPATLIVLIGAQMRGDMDWTSTSSLNLPPSQATQLLQRGIEVIYNYITLKQLEEVEFEHHNKKSPK